MRTKFFIKIIILILIAVVVIVININIIFIFIIGGSSGSNLVDVTSTKKESELSSISYIVGSSDLTAMVDEGETDVLHLYNSATIKFTFTSRPIVGHTFVNTMKFRLCLNNAQQLQQQ